jgi:inorganic pyrophosphatase
MGPNPPPRPIPPTQGEAYKWSIIWNCRSATAPPRSFARDRNPLDGTQKFEYDKQLHVFKLDRNLHSPVHYPGDYGFIPSTLSDDGDPLDVLVLVPGPSFPGCVQEVRPIGLLEMLDQGVLDEKVLAVGKNNPRFANVWNYTDIYPHMLKEITHFFSIYKDLEGKRVEIKGWHDAAYARDHVVRAVKQFEESKAKKAEAV